MLVLLLFVLLAVAVVMAPKRTSPTQTLATSDKGDVPLEKFDNSRSNLSFQRIITLPQNLLFHPSNYQSRHSVLKSRNNIERDHALDSQSSYAHVGTFGNNAVGMGGMTIDDVGVGDHDTPVTENRFNNGKTRFEDVEYAPVNTNYCGCSGFYAA